MQQEYQETTESACFQSVWKSTEISKQVRISLLMLESEVTSVLSPSNPIWQVGKIC